MTDSTHPMESCLAGVDDGYAFTKVALPNGRLIAVPSRVRTGTAGVTWMRDDEHKIFEYETDGGRYAVGSVDGEPTQYDEFPGSAMNRVLVQHALQQAGLAGRSVDMVTGLPIAAFYRRDGQQRCQAIQKKRDSLRVPVEAVRGQYAGQTASGSNPRKASIAYHEVIPEALAAWYDHVIVMGDDGVTLEENRVNAPIAIVDIGGRTTDFVVVQDQGIVHRSSGSLGRGMLDVYAKVREAIEQQFDLGELGEQTISRAVETLKLRLHGKDHDVSTLVSAATRELVEQLYSETRRKLGLGAELDEVVFVGGGSEALRDDIANWFPNQLIAEHAAFANARGMLKYLQFVCEIPGRSG
jgi:plasmid segregation protein ParM